ncbi:hypothetical protein DI09_10p420 [Mitosporidium daphniae]|uniref:Uncharacterized protein n=1 Tax=Mitosporidium daphniae TaxID=1485682 RepID=A0A098VW47_9MICR|nr:uncharacterized protein DI09_10p420 [Mitosporidium daphniae]KGG53145.1 hypothetical protein DI09_10p420 [Mitosporidium daphniae]|eukprot:XP_013239572.1 uncharacterized protein DI09_10p420 [Mitosporidium daphniae]
MGTSSCSDSSSCCSGSSRNLSHSSSEGLSDSDKSVLSSDGSSTLSQEFTSSDDEEWSESTESSLEDAGDDEKEFKVNVAEIEQDFNPEAEVSPFDPVDASNILPHNRKRRLIPREQQNK